MNKQDFSQPLPKGFIKAYSQNSVRGAAIKHDIFSSFRSYVSFLQAQPRKKFKKSVR